MPETEKLYQLLENSAARSGDRTAVVFLDQSITYRELNERASEISQKLREAGVDKDSRVAICSPKSLTAVACVFGISKAGSAYLPVDFSSPVERNKFIIRDCEVSALILSKELYLDFSQDFSFVCDLDDGLVLAKNNSAALRSSPPDLAYVLYTSGSTGNPKGVMYSNQGAMQFINWSSSVFSPSQVDRFSSHAPFHFDLSIFDLFVSIKHGATLVLIKEETAKQPLLLAQLVAEQKISIWYSTPTILMMMSEYGKMEKYDYSGLHTVLFAGEVFPVNKFRSLREKIAGADYYNLYGPTETNVCTYYKVPQEIPTSIPIGKVCEHYKSIVLDGELLIGGNGVMLGYWNVPGREAFYKDKTGEQFYKTGDIVDVDNDGNFVFKGRRDRMVKRNGYRIELDEIETALNKHECTVVNAVVAAANTEEQMTITAFVVLKNGEEKSLIKMKEYCMNHLPSYMVPNDIIFVTDLPYTSSNKVDYQKLKQSL